MKQMLRRTQTGQLYTITAFSTCIMQLIFFYVYTAIIGISCMATKSSSYLSCNSVIHLSGRMAECQMHTEKKLLVLVVASVLFCSEYEDLKKNNCNSHSDHLAILIAPSQDLFTCSRTTKLSAICRDSRMHTVMSSHQADLMYKSSNVPCLVNNSYGSKQIYSRWSYLSYLLTAVVVKWSIC